MLRLEVQDTKVFLDIERLKIISQEGMTHLTSQLIIKVLIKF